MLVNNPPVEIADRLWMLGTAAYPLYLFKGREDGTIFEGGTGAMGPVLRQQLQQLGIDREYVKQVVVTHAHPDHVMAVPLFREMLPELQVLASAKAAETLSVDKAVAFFAQMDDALSDSLVRTGVVAEEDRRGALAENRIPVDRTLQEGDTVEVDEGAAFNVLETPGHSDCSLSFHEPVRKVLIISDATGYYMPRHGCWWPNYFTDYAAYVRSIERLAALEAEVLCLSHNGAIRGADDVADYFRRALEATRNYHQRIVDETAAGKSPRQIAEVLGSEVYEKTPLMPVAFFQKNCGLMVKLSLRHEGLGEGN